MLAKLAFGNMRKLMHDYAVYFLTLVMGVAVFYAFNTISVQADFLSNSLSDVLKQVGEIMHGLTVFLAVIMGFLMVYANNFLMRRRKKELGLYQVLGMRAGQVNAILTLETLMVALISFIVGIALGALISQLLLFVTADMFATKVDNFRFFFSPDALALTFFCFAITFLVMMVMNSITLSRVHLIDLMSAGRKNAMISQMMSGVHMMAAMNMATLKRIVKPPRAVSTTSWPPFGRYSRIGSTRMSTIEGVASYMTTAVMMRATTMMVRRRLSSPRWSMMGMRAGPMGIGMRLPG